MLKCRKSFTISENGKAIRGNLCAPVGVGAGNSYPLYFIVMIDNFYLGCLQWNQSAKDWWLPDSKLEKYTDHLGNTVEAWFE